MKTTHSKKTDSAYIYLAEIKKGGVTKTHPCEIEGIKGEINLDFDKNGRLVGIEILGASKALPTEFLERAEKLD